MSLIEVEGLSKNFRHAVKGPGLSGAIKHLFTQTYRDKLAVDSIDLTIEEGESVAYVGPNGAGKSTTIKMLTGILVPTAGKIIVDGINPYKKRMENAKKIGAVFGQRTQLWWDIPVSESLSLLKDIYEIPSAVYEENMEIFTDLLGMRDFSHLSARKLSLGQRMRTDLAAALLHNPKIVYLDEPTIGLDVAVKEKIRKFIKHINKERGTTVMLTTHDLGDIEDLCKRLVIVDHGKIIYDGSIEAVKDAFARERILHFQVNQSMESLEKAIRDLPGTMLLKNDGLQFSISFDRFHITAGEVAGHIMKFGDVVDFRIDEPSIEQIIKRVYGGELDLSQLSLTGKGA